MSDEYGHDVEPKGSAKCPVCGRFSHIVRVVNDSAPMSAEVSFAVTVDCRQHGRGLA